MKRLCVLLLVFVCLPATGCFHTCTETIRFEPLGELNVAEPSQTFESAFVVPAEVWHLSLVFNDREFSEADLHSWPDTPLVLLLTMREISDRGSAVSREITSEDMQFTNWHCPSSSLLLVTGKADLPASDTYKLTIEVLDEAKDLGMGEVTLSWIDYGQ